MKTFLVKTYDIYEVYNYVYYLIEINKISKSFLKLPISINNEINIIAKIK